MDSEDQIARLLEAIVRSESLDPDDPASEEQYAAFYSRNHQILMLTWAGWEMLEEVVDRLHQDVSLSESLTRDEVGDEVIAAAMQAARALGQGGLDAPSLSKQLLDVLHEGQDNWHFLALVPGLQMPPGLRFDLARMTFGPLSDEEREEHIARADRIGSTMYFADIREPGSAREHVVRASVGYLEGNDCWARGVIRCREKALDGIVRERLNVVALNVLRCFAPVMDEDPDRIHLGQPHIAAVNKVLHFTVTDRGTVDSYVEGHSRYGDRFPLFMSAQDVEHLEGFEPYVRARNIVERWIEDPDSIGDLENKILLAMLQFGTAASLDPREVKLQNYLTVLETLYGRDVPDKNDDFKKVARRASLAFPESDRAGFRDTVRQLYRIRRRPVHYGERGLRGREVVSENDARLAEWAAFEVLMYALTRSPDFGGKGSYEAFLDALDAKLSTVPAGKREYWLVTWRDPTEQQFHALAPDFPGIRGSGETADAAYRDARDRMDAEIERLAGTGQPIPATTAKVRTAHLPVPSTSDRTGVKDGGGKA